ncbi:MAG: hypothetical protein AB7H97_07085, partial [Pseudobdellovibrionaceae bacterium]
AINILFYMACFIILGKIVDRFFPSKIKQMPHPVIKAAWSIYRPIIAVIVGLVLVLGSFGYEPLIIPTIIILLGLMFNLFGRFSEKTVVFVSWMFIVSGLLMAAMTKFEMSMWTEFSFIFLVGIGHFVMGVSLRRAESRVSIGA